jgi:hypothetical protein
MDRLRRRYYASQVPDGAEIVGADKHDGAIVVYCEWHFGMSRWARLHLNTGDVVSLHPMVCVDVLVDGDAPPSLAELGD